MNKYLNIFSFISVFGTLIWVSSDFYGGMIIFAFMYGWLLVPILFGYAITFTMTISRIIQKGFKQVIFSASIHLFGICTLTSFSLYDAEIFKAETVLEAILIDDLSSISIRLRSDYTFNTTVNGMFGFVERINGKYHLDQDTIKFVDPPYSNDFIPNKIIIDRKDSALYFNKLANGEFDRTKSFVNYFEIRNVKL